MISSTCHIISNPFCTFLLDMCVGIHICYSTSHTPLRLSFFAAICKGHVKASLPSLFARVKPFKSTWMLELNGIHHHPHHPHHPPSSSSSSRQPIATLQPMLEEVQMMWWERVVSGDALLIDMTMVDSTRHIGTYDNETQGEIRRAWTRCS
jgi:hypothetical protein